MSRSVVALTAGRKAVEGSLQLASVAFNSRGLACLGLAAPQLDRMYAEVFGSITRPAFATARAPQQLPRSSIRHPCWPRLHGRRLCQLVASQSQANDFQHSAVADIDVASSSRFSAAANTSVQQQALQPQLQPQPLLFKSPGEYRRNRRTTSSSASQTAQTASAAATASGLVPPLLQQHEQRGSHHSSSSREPLNGAAVYSNTSSNGHGNGNGYTHDAVGRQQQQQPPGNSPRWPRTRSNTVSYTPHMQQLRYNLQDRQQGALGPTAGWSGQQVHWQQGQQLPQQQQQQQSDFSDLDEYHPTAVYQQQLQTWPSELLQPPPAGPLLLDVTAMLTWPAGSPPGLDKWAAKWLPPDLDQQQLLWVSVYQPGGPGSSAAIWVGRTFCKASDNETLDRSELDQAAVDQVTDQTLDASDLSDHLGTAAAGPRWIVMSSDLIRFESDAERQGQQQELLQQQQEQQQQEQQQHEEPDQQKGRRLRRRPQQKQRPRQQKQQQQQRLQPQPLVKPGQIWLEVQQRPHLGTAPVAVVEGMTFTCHSRSLPVLSHPSSSSSNRGSSPAVAAVEHLQQDQQLTDQLQHQQQEKQQREEEPATTEEGLEDTLDMPGGRMAAQQAQSAAAAAEAAALADHGAADGWYDYLLLQAGDFSVMQNECMFPNMLAHCSDGRVMYCARNAQDIASFVAAAVEADLQNHMRNLIRIAWDKRDDSMYGPDWVWGRLTQRWGPDALRKFGVDWNYFNERYIESGVVPQAAEATRVAV